MKYMQKALVAGGLSALFAVGAAYANAIPQITSDELWVMSGALVAGFITGIATFYAKYGPSYLRRPLTDEDHAKLRPAEAEWQ